MGSWQHKGIDIYSTPDGEFSASIEDARFKHQTFAGIKAELDIALAAPKRTLALNVIALGSATNQSRFDKQKSMLVAQVIGVNKTTSAFQFANKLTDLSHVMADTPANRERLNVLLDAQAALLRAQAEVTARVIQTGSYGRIQDGDYERIITAVEAKYEISKTEQPAADGI